MFRLIRSLLDPRPLPVSRLPETVRDDATQMAREPDPDASWGEAWARAESASAALAASLARVTQARLTFEAAIAESDEAVKVEEAAYKAMLAAKASSKTVH
jgi:hypothetical protein